ncbi:MAG TPA: 50S ribosomal protein L6 [Candidatus Korarchaeota archaeon]|nr:MAG: 50S ribosomal protein L6 [Candidatus Korarchaeota archaeon]HDD68881.1 50S ribosomal protein L6 [Candidatus Korarchaeota archaeon]
MELPKRVWNKVANFSLTLEVDIEKDVEVSLDGEEIVIRGPKGELRKKFNSRILDVNIDEERNKVVLRVFNPRKFERSYLNTMKSHIRNMMLGVTRGFRKTLIVAYAHFPIRVEVDEKNKIILIHNFLGEKKPRKAKIVGESTKVTVEGDKIIVEGISKEEVGQTAANLRQATKIKRKDPRVFMDGIYILKEG